MTGHGVYFIKHVGSPTLFSIRFVDFAEGSTNTIAEIKGKTPMFGFSVAPDESNILYCLAQAQFDLMLVENFR